MMPAEAQLVHYIFVTYIACASTAYDCALNWIGMPITPVQGQELCACQTMSGVPIVCHVSIADFFCCALTMVYVD